MEVLLAVRDQILHRIKAAITLGKHHDRKSKVVRKIRQTAETLLSFPVETRLKFYQRPPQELPRLDLVLPKIPYTLDLKKAFEKAIQRSRSRPTLECGLNTGAQEKKVELFNSLPRNKAEKVLQRRLSDSSIIIGDEKPTENKPTNGEGSSKFSELSSINLDGWSPFTAWGAKDSTLRPNRTPPMKRGRSMSSLIPSSILY